MGAFEITSVRGNEPLDWQIDLANQKALGEFVNHRSHLGNYLLHFRTIGRVKRNNCLVRRFAGCELRIWRIVPELIVLDQMPQNIDAKTVHAAA